MATIRETMETLATIATLMAATAALPGQSIAHAAQPAQAPERRLIQTGPGQRSWMSSEEINALIQRSHEAGHCGGFVDVTEHPEDDGATARPWLGFLVPRSPAHAETVNRLLPQLSLENVLASVAKLSSYPTRYYTSETGVEAASWIQSEFARIAQGRTDVAIELFRHSFKQPSVIARIAGQGPHAGERVILGAHEDSIYWDNWTPLPGKAAPGADDDASGIATLLETFRVLIDSGYRPDRTIEFIAYAGEERGLLGSQDIARKYRQQKVPVAGVLQLDMTMYPGAQPRIHLIQDDTDPALNRFLGALIDAYVRFPWGWMRCGYACSDHASWNEAGYPATLPFEAEMEESNPHIHSDKDTLEWLTPDFGMHFAKLATAFAVEMAGEK